MPNKYFVNGGINNNWGDASNWSLTPGGPGGAGQPAATDDAFFDGSSPNCTVNVPVSPIVREAKSLTFTGYTNTFTIAATTLSVFGNVTLSPTTNLAGTGTMRIRSSATITSYTSFIKPMPFALSLAGPITVTFSDDLYITGSFLPHSGFGGTTTLIGNNVYASAAVSTTNNGNIVGGTTNLRMQAGSTLTSTAVGLYNIPIFFEGGLGTITITANPNTLYFGNGAVLTWVSGTVNTSNANNILLTNGCVLNTPSSGMTWKNISFLQNQSPTITLNAPITITNFLTYSLGTNVTFIGTSGWTANTFRILTTGSQIHTLKAGVTYTVTNDFTSNASLNNLNDTLRSSTPGTKAIFTLNPGATQSVAFTNATDIDSSQGQIIYSVNGTITNTDNWNVLSPSTIGTNTFIFIR